MKDNNPLSFGIMLSLYTGLRIGKVFSLKLEDIDLTNKQLNVRRTISVSRKINAEDKVTRGFNELKIEKGKRVIPLPDFLATLLARFITDRNDMVEALGGNWYGNQYIYSEDWKDEGYLFVSSDGTVPTTTTIRLLFKRILREAGVEHVSFYALRHTFATRCIEAGFDVKSLSDILGHVDTSMTLNTYECVK